MRAGKNRIMGGYPSQVAVRAWARLTKAQHQALTAVEQALSAAKLPPLAWYDVLLELERAGGSLRPFELEREMLLAQYNLSGKSLRRCMWPVYGSAIQATIGDRLSPKQVDALGALLSGLIGKPAK